MPGTIVFRPLEAKLTRGNDLIFKMNPYCSFSLGDQKFTSEVCKKGGKHPTWSDSISIPASNASFAKLELMDKEKLTKDDVIGSCSIDLKSIASEGSHSKKWYSLFFEDKPAGEILLETDLEGDFSKQGWSMKSTSMERDLSLKPVLDTETIIIVSDVKPSLETTSASFSSDLKTTSKTVILESDLSKVAEQRSEFISSGLPTLEISDKKIIDQKSLHIEQGESKFFTEQHQVVESRTFMKDVQTTETVAVEKQIEVLEERTVLRDVEYTEAVPVMKEIEVVEPVVVKKEVEVMEPRVVQKIIEVIENVPVKKMVDVVEMKHSTKMVETMEPRTFTKQVEVVEHVPVMKTVTVSEPVTVTKQVEFIEPVVTTQTITKEIKPEVIINQTVSIETLPATVVGVTQKQYMSELKTEIIEERTLEEKISTEERFVVEKTLEQALLSEEVGEQEFSHEEGEKKSKKSRKHNKHHAAATETL